LFILRLFEKEHILKNGHFQKSITKILQHLETQIWCQIDPHIVFCPEQKKNLYTLSYRRRERHVTVRPNVVRAVRPKLATTT